MRFFNPEGDVDALYWVELEDELSPYVNCDFCGTEFLVPNGTQRTDGYVTQTLTFHTIPEQPLETGFYIYGKPEGANESGVLTIRPRVKVKVFLNMAPTTTTTTTTTTMPTTTTQGGWWGNIIQKLFPTTTTTTLPDGATTTSTTAASTTAGNESQTVPEEKEPATIFGMKPILAAIYGLGIVILILIIMYAYINYIQFM